MQRSLMSMAGAALALLGVVSAQAMTPREECAPASVPEVCLDAKLKQANLRLNAALKEATRQIEVLQKNGERPVLTAFVNSQRQFNAYRDANCAWQAIAVPRQERSAFIKDCQIRTTVAREQELLAFASGQGPSPVAEPAADPAADAVVDPQGAAHSADAASAPPASAVRTDGPPRADAAPAADERDLVETVTVQAPAAERPAVVPPRPRAQAPAAGRDAAAGGGVEWLLHSWQVDGAAVSLLPESRITVAFDPSGKVAGNGSVNTFRGDFRFDQDGRLLWPKNGFAVTRMSAAPELMKQERAFLQTLRRMSDFRADGERLILESASGRTVLTFARQQ